MTIVMTGTSSMKQGEYDQVMTYLAGQLAAVAHLARQDADGRLSLIEVWDSAEQQRAWFDARVRPLLPADAPQPAVEHVHNVLLAAKPS